VSVRAAALWGIGGVLALLVHAIHRLAGYALELFEHALGIGELIALVAWVAFNGYAEGYRAFHQLFAPRVVARAQVLERVPRWCAVLAPLYCMGLVHATRKRLIVSWCLTFAIVGVVLLIRHVDQPWRGIIDAGVVVGLGWGVASIVYYTARAFAGHAMPVPPDLPPQPAHAHERQ
jgi:hypothetical protein